MKPLGAKWLVKLYDHLCSNPAIIRNGFWFSECVIWKLSGNLYLGWHWSVFHCKLIEFHHRTSKCSLKKES
jgi:hypothetical protein